MLLYIVIQEEERVEMRRVKNSGPVLEIVRHPNFLVENVNLRG